MVDEVKPAVKIVHVESFSADDGRQVQKLSPIDGSPPMYIGVVRGAQVQVMNQKPQSIDFNFDIQAMCIEEAFEKFMALAEEQFKKIVEEIKAVQDKANSRIVVAGLAPKLPPGGHGQGLRIARG